MIIQLSALQWNEPPTCHYIHELYKMLFSEPLLMIFFSIWK